MDLAKILPTVTAIGSDLPAYKQLFDIAVTVLHPGDQATAKQAYANAMVAAERAHAAAQAI